MPAVRVVECLVVIRPIPADFWYELISQSRLTSPHPIARITLIDAEHDRDIASTLAECLQDCHSS